MAQRRSNRGLIPIIPPASELFEDAAMPPLAAALPPAGRSVFAPQLSFRSIAAASKSVPTSDDTSAWLQSLPPTTSDWLSLAPTTAAPGGESGVGGPPALEVPSGVQVCTILVAGYHTV
jgi:hypothetical protein